MTPYAKLCKLGACTSSLIWVRDRPPTYNWQELWNVCQRADWMLWLAARAGVLIEAQVLIACDILEGAAMPGPGEVEDWCAAAFDGLRAWAHREGSGKELGDIAGEVPALHGDLVLGVRTLLFTPFDYEHLGTRCETPATAVGYGAPFSGEIVRQWLPKCPPIWRAR